MDAVVLAGGTPQPDDPLYPYTQGKPKALLEMAGKPMAQWVLDALSASPEIGHIYIVGLTAQDGLQTHKPVTYLPNQGSILANILAGLRAILQDRGSADPAAEYSLIASADIPTITPEIVDWTASNARDLQADLVYHVIPRETMEKRFPGANRTYLRLKDVEVCGADLNVVRTSIANTNTEIFGRLIAARKNPLKEAAILGWKTLLMIALRRWTLQRVVAEASARIGIRGVGVISPYAEMAMDADKPHQVEILRADLARHSQTEVAHG